MPTDTLTFGISKIVGLFIDKLRIKGSMTVAERKDSQGTTARVYPHDPKNEVTIDGGGVAPMALGAVEAPGITGITGGVFIVKETENGETNDGFNDFTISATHYPSATVGTAPGNAGT